MEKRYVVPAVTFLAGLLIWIIFFVFTILYWKSQMPLWASLIIGMLPGGLILFSGARCRQVGGPKIGTSVRAGVLFVLAIFTWWKIGMIAAGILFASAVVTGLLALDSKA